MMMQVMLMERELEHQVEVEVVEVEAVGVEAVEAEVVKLLLQLVVQDLDQASVPHQDLLPQTYSKEAQLMLLSTA